MAENNGEEKGVTIDPTTGEKKERTLQQQEAEPQQTNTYRANLPKAIFVEDVEKFMRQPENSSAEKVLKQFDEQHTKYKFMESNLLEKKRRLRSRLPDIKKTLSMINFLKSIEGTEKSVSTHYQLAAGVLTTAEIPPTDTVCLWLGANVMLEYPIDEAKELLTQNLTNATKSLAGVEEDLEYITEQCTTLEVAMTRVYNWDVKERRDRKLTTTKTSTTTSAK